MKKNSNKKEILKKLLKENRYYDISESFLTRISFRKVMKFESMMETGKKYNDLSYKIRDLIVYKNFNLKEVTYHVTKQTLNLVGACLAPAILVNALYSGTINKQNTQNIEIITEYDNELKEYASKYNTDTMSTMDIIMSVMNDIRSNTEYGFDFEGEEIGDSYRLILNGSNDIGVCRHMADKFTATMNMIDPRFEARNLFVHLSHECNTLTLCDVENPFSEEFKKQLVKEKEKNKEEEKDLKEQLEDEIAANHLVTVLKPIDEDYYLVVDVTNPSIGVLRNGKIYMFNSNDYSFIEYRPYQQFIMNADDSYYVIRKDMFLSYFQNYNLDNLDELYGLDSQNKVLEKIKTN